MRQYLELLQDILDNGQENDDRTGVGTLSVFGRMLKFDLLKGFPLVTTRKTHLRIAFEETMFFLRGQTDTKILEDKNIKIWKGNSSREFLDKHGYDWPEGEIGPGSYGALWRKFPKGNGNGYIDQIKDLLEGLKNNPKSRRHIVSAWHPDWSLNNAALPECHILQQYYVTNDEKLNNLIYLRSGDLSFGTPYNISGYSLLNKIFANYLGLKSGELTIMYGDVHIYKNQIDMVTKQLKRIPRELPKLIINKELNTFDDMLNLQYIDLELSGYDPYPDFKDKPKMAV